LVEKKSALTNLCLVSIHRIAEGNFYEAHQQLRVITSRYLKSSDYTSACDVLYNGALLLLRAGQGGSGGDLAMMLLNEVYNKGEFVCNDVNKKRLFEILHAFPPDEPTRKRFVTETVGWSGRFGELERGDPEVQDQVGRVFANGTCVCVCVCVKKGPAAATRSVERQITGPQIKTVVWFMQAKDTLY
jgi:hypothetical protein